jgi:hypothetical protein
MEFNNVRAKVSLIAALAAISWFAVSESTGATPDTGPNVTFTAAGTFASPPISGTDTLKLAGEPFSIAIVAAAGSVPIKHGRNWAVISPLKMTGVVHSGLLGSNPVNIASAGASIYQAVGPSYDPFQTAFPVRVVGISLTIDAQITLPAGTLAKPLIHPFAAVALSPANTIVTYSDGTNTTTLAVQSGTLAAALPTGGDAVRIK